ncbi:MAG: RHS repeat-associated core domain-containing protein [Candidatus Calescibacterium sp.]
MGVRKEDRSVWAGGNNYVFWYSVGERVIRGRANFESGAGVIAVEVDFEGNAWAILRNVKKVVKIKSKPVVLGCDKTCGEGFEGTPLIQVGSWGSVSANSGKLAVNLASGNLYLPILLIPTFDELSLNFGISYNSLDKDILGFLGKGWTHSFFAEVKGDESGAYLRFFDGKVIKFSKFGEIYVPESFAGSSFFKALKRNQDGSWILEVRGGGRFEFSREGRILKIKDVKGREWSFEYDDGGRLSEIKDPVGRALRFLWDGMRITAVKDAVGNEWRFFYEGGGEFLASIKDPEGNFVHFGYSVGRLSEVLDFSGSRWLILYDEKGRVSEVQDPKGRPFRIEYFEGSGNQIFVKVSTRLGYSLEYIVDKQFVSTLAVKDEIGAERNYSYDERGNITKYKDARGNEWRYEYDGNGNLTKIEDPMGYTEKFFYDFSDLLTAHVKKDGNVERYFYDRGNLVRKVDAMGFEWRGEYNNLGLLVKEVLPTGSEIRYEYDSFGHIRRKIDALGNVWKYEYDVLGKLVLEEDPAGNRTRYEYDVLGRMTKKIDAVGGVWKFRYDAFGNLVEQKDPLGNTKKYYYDFLGNLTAEVDQVGNVALKEYDAEGQKIRETDFKGNSVLFEYDGAGRLVRYVNQLGGETLNEYDKEGNRVRVRHPSGLIEESQYDALGRVIFTKVFDPGTGISYEAIYEYDAQGNTIKIESGGLVSRYFYDALGRIVKEIDPAGNERTYEYDPVGRLVRKVEADGTEVRYEYDANGNLVKVVNQDGTEVKYEYDAVGRLTAFIDEVGGRTEYGYDGVGRIIFIKDPAGSITRYEYDIAGRLVAVQDGEGNITRYEYDARGNVIAVIGPEGERTEFKLDENGNVVEILDPEGNITRFEYNSMGLLSAQVSPGGSRTEYFYDSVGRLIKTVYPNGGTEWFVYDGFGRVIVKGDAEGRVVGYEYDSFGNLVKVIYQDGVVNMFYDNLGRLTKKVYPDGKEVEYGYDRLGRLIFVRGNGAEIENKYDVMGRLKMRTFKISGILPVSVEYGYDGAGRKVLVKDLWGETRYIYDKAGRVIEVRSEGLSAQIFYDRTGRRILLKYPNGVETKYIYGGNGGNCNGNGCRNPKLTKIEITSGDGKMIWNAKYSYSKGGFIVEEDQLKKKIRYEYDKDGQIKKADVFVKENPKRSYGFLFEYDRMGNRVAMELYSQVEGLFDPRFPRPKDKEPALKHPVRFEYAYNRAGEILGFVARRTKDGSFWYSAEFKHDLRGNVSQKRVILSDGTSYTTNYLHDFENRLWKILFPGGEESEFLILEGFVLKRRYQDEEGKMKEINLIYDGDQVLLELDEKGEPIKRYVLGAERDEILWVKKVRQKGEDGKGSGDKSKGKGKGKGKEGERRDYIFYHYDQGGNLVILTDFAGDVVAEYEYSPFGEVLEAQGPEAKKNRFLFAGRYYISEGGVYDFRARVLDGRLGRFLEREPLVGERMGFLSMYSYARNNPVNFKDTTGLYFESVRNRVRWMISELLKVGCISNSNVRRDWSCQISFRTFSEFEHSVKIIFYALTSLQYATWRYGKVPLPNFAGIAQNAFNNDFLPKFKEGLKIMITSEKSKFRGTISRWWVRRSTMDFFTDEFFKISEKIIDQLCENVIVIEIDLRRIIKRLATMVWTPWEFKWLTDVFGKELEKFINDFISLFKDGYSIKIMVPIPVVIRLIAALFGRLLPEETPFNITRLGPLSYLFIAYFETLLFHPSDLVIHREIKYEILKKFCDKLKRFYPELPCVI